MQQGSQPSTLVLEASLDSTRAAPLLQALRERRGVPLQVSAAGVVRAGTLCLQAIGAAAIAWKADGYPFTVVNPSPQFSEAVSLLGMSSDQIPMEPTAT